VRHPWDDVTIVLATAAVTKWVPGLLEVALRGRRRRALERRDSDAVRRVREFTQHVERRQPPDDVDRIQ